MSDATNERDDNGELTPYAIALDALADYGCDCGTDEPGTCLSCVCEAAMMTERTRAEAAEAERDQARRSYDFLEDRYEAAESEHGRVVSALRALCDSRPPTYAAFQAARELLAAHDRKESGDV